MKFVTCIILILLSSIVTAQDNFKIYCEKTVDGYEILTDNREYSPVSVEINFKIKNLVSSIGNRRTVIVPAQVGRYLVANLTVQDVKKGYSVGYTVKYSRGNCLQASYDTDYVYHLPFRKEETYTVTQGYNGAISHQGENALDFGMPIGTEIHAAREGIVALVQEKYDKSCSSSQDCAKFNNYILVYHSDGTFAEYTHIKKNGSKVTAGDHVAVGQFIGYSGNVGWSTGPHLHFVVFLQRFKERETLPTKFFIGNGIEAVELEEKKEYYRVYE